MRALLLLSVLGAAAWPLAAGAQSFEGGDWQVVCDNTRTCRAAGYSVDGSDMPVSVLLVRAAGGAAAVYGELQLGTLGDHAAHPASVNLATGGRTAVAIHVDKANHAALPPAALQALLRTVLVGGDAVFSSGKASWRVSGIGAAEALQKMDDVQGRSGRRSALVRKGGGSDAEAAYPVTAPRVQAAPSAAGPRPGDDALAVRVLAAIHSSAECPLLDDGAAQARGRLWHLDANRLLVTQPCVPGAADGVGGWWQANLRPPYDARPLTYSGRFDGVASVAGRDPGDCGKVEAWAWNGYRFEQTYAAVGGLCRGVKAGGSWELPTLVTEVVPAN